MLNNGHETCAPFSTVRRTDTQNKPNSAGINRKRSLPAPTTLPQFAMALLLHFCRRYLLLNLNIKLLAYACIVIFGSFVRDFVRLPNVYLSQKNNALNLYFVKFSWGWTLILIGPFIYCTAKVYSAGDSRNVAKHISRLAVSTIICFFLCSRLFNYIGRSYGLCTKTAHTNDYRTCLSAGGKWVPFDISGHVFLLLYICLLHAEEAAVFRHWDRIKLLIDRYASDKTPPQGILTLSATRIAQVAKDYDFYTPAIRLNFVLITIANLIWELCLVITVFYYHTAAQKFVAFALALVCWYLTYKVWYRSPWSPGMPGLGRVCYTSR